MQTIQSKGLTAGSLFKLLFIGFFVTLFIFSVVCGVASYFGYETITINGEHVFGLKGLIAGLVLGIVLPLVMTIVTWIWLTIGIWIWTRFKTITLNVKE